MLHELRKNYGWTDEYILDHIEVYGGEWLTEQYQLCREGLQQEITLLANVLPMARTPMGKKAASAMKRMIKDIQNTINNIAPWSRRKKYEAKKRALKRQGVKPGEMVVVLGPGERSDLGLYEGAKIVKDK